MALFDIPNRASNDLMLAKKVNNASIKAPITVKGSGGLMAKMETAIALVEKHLGKYRDEYILIQDEDSLIRYIDKSIENGVIAIDTETTGLDVMLDGIAGICVYTPVMKGAYIPINHISYMTQNKISDQLPAEFIIEQFDRLIEAKPDIIMFNADFDIRVMRKFGVKDIYCTWDCYLAQRLLNENEPVNRLKILHQKYVLDGKADAFTFDELFKGIPFTYVPLKTAVLYAAHDPKITYELYEYQKQYLREDIDREDLQKIYWVFKNIEMPLVKVVADMEDAGVKFDFKCNEKLKDKYHALLDEREEAFHKLCDKYDNQIQNYRDLHRTNCKLENPINIKSTDQLAILFYDILDLPLFYDKKKKKETRSTAEEHLSTLDHELAKAVLNYREFSTIVSTFIDKLPECVNPNDGRIHCKFNQYGADTGRFSSSDPNLQNIPSHITDIRQMFVAGEGCVLMSSDFSQQEPKALAALCRKEGDSQLYNTFMQGKDLYSEIASKSFNVPYEDCLEFNSDGTTNKEGKARRTQAKSILLGILYGRGEASIAEQLGCTLEKAKAIKESVFNAFPILRKFESDSKHMAQDIGYVTTVCGRKRRLPDMQLPTYDFKWSDEAPIADDVLDFDSEDTTLPVPQSRIRYYLSKLRNCRYNQKQYIFKEANKEGIWIIDNGGKIADAERQCVNSRIQGSAADLTKLAMIDMSNNERLKELGFRLLIPVHDEVIAECPQENAKECSKLLADVMCKAAEKILEMPIKCDVVVSKEWYGKEIKL